MGVIVCFWVALRIKYSYIVDFFPLYPNINFNISNNNCPHQYKYKIFSYLWINIKILLWTTGICKNGVADKIPGCFLIYIQFNILLKIVGNWRKPNNIKIVCRLIMGSYNYTTIFLKRIYLIGCHVIVK